jgi:sugar phosphate isomerase/epimerase
MIRLGCCAFNFALDLEDALRLVRYLGFRYVDVGATGPTAQVNPVEAARHPKRFGAEVRELATRYELALCELFACSMLVDGRTVDTNHPDRRVRRRLLRQFRGLCQFAAEAGFESVMGVPGKLQASLGESGSWDVTAETLSKMITIAREYGVGFNVEPSSNSILHQPETALHMARQIPGLTFTLDYAHFVGQGFSHRDITPLQTFARHVHAKQAKSGYMKCPFHEGEIDFGIIVRELQARKWEGVIATECIGRLDRESPLRRPIYQSILASGQALIPDPSLISHPLFQTLVLAQEIERVLSATQQDQGT